ncbi:unnamed protein product [Thlaspi arvense]|uniref:Fe2OG dioxygenase domain-containing protein n=1 Tax=Thlaspi arvense TaxID=13288 RepID=A0AAU9RI56_THLAR|nr:unnamed protein product [Thlaspi arvense]
MTHVMEDYQKEMKLLSETMVGSMLKSLGVMPEDVNWFKPNKRSSHHSQALLQLNSYPVCPDPTRAMGLGPHTDSSLVTLLYQSNTSGLQLRGDGGWITVPPLAGAIIVNVGDLMHCTSPAVVDKVEHRISVAYFYGPPREVQISPSMKLTDLDHPPLYWPVTWKQYLDAKAVYFNRALDLIRVDKFSAQKMNTLVLDSSI